MSWLLPIILLSFGFPKAEASQFAPNSFQDCPNCPVMTVVPPGRFIMGADDQRESYGPAHDRSIAQPFAVAQTETTFAQYQTCVDAGICKTIENDHGWGRGHQPVINVSWHDANDYADWLSRITGKPYRLPTEVEWEYAARAGTVARYPWGEAVGEGNANCRNCGTDWSGRKAAPVAQFAPNGFGLYDMNGNVSEWVADCWVERHSPLEGAPPADSSPRECTARVTRGGDWYYVPILSTSAARKPNAPILWSYTIGFRVVVDIDE